MRVVILACLAVVMLAGVTSADDDVRPIDEFRILKVGKDTSLQDFLKLHPTARRLKSSDEKYGVQEYAVLNESGGDAVFKFLNGKMYYMCIFWFRKYLDRDGGWEPIVNKIVKKYGKADAGSPVGTLRWRSLETKNALVILVDDSTMTVGFIENDLDKKLGELKSIKNKSQVD